MGDANRQSSETVNPQMQCAINASQGDDAAFQQFMDAHLPAIRRFIELRIDDRLRHRVSASDILQETSLEAHRRLADFVRRRPMSPRVWLLKMAFEQLRDARVKHLDRERRAVDRGVPLPEHSSMALAQELAHHASPSAEAMRAERRESIAKILNRLASIDREILLLRHIDELTYGEIAVLLQIKATTARKRYTRALIRLQALCDDDTESESEL